MDNYTATTKNADSDEKDRLHSDLYDNNTNQQVTKFKEENQHRSQDRKYSKDDSDCPSPVSDKPASPRRLSWTRFKKIITDNRVLLGRLSPENKMIFGRVSPISPDNNRVLLERLSPDSSGQCRKVKDGRGSWEIDYDVIDKHDDSIRKKDGDHVRRRKWLYRNKYSFGFILLLAISESDETVISKIINNSKVDINMLYPPGSTILHQACVFGNLAIIKLLVRNGADVEIKTWSGLSSVQIATLFGHFEVAQYLIQQGASCRDVQDGFFHDVKLMSTVFIQSF